MRITELIIVPAWLNLIKRELGITNDDLACFDKLSGILSTRDLLIYRTLNDRAHEVLAKFFPGGQQAVSKLFQDFYAPIKPLTLEERAFTANQDIDTLIYGATCTKDKDQQLFAEVCLTDTEQLCICLVPFSRASEELKNDGKSLAEKITTVVFQRFGLKDTAESEVFRQYVNEVPINTVLY